MFNRLISIILIFAFFATLLPAPEALALRQKVEGSSTIVAMSGNLSEAKGAGLNEILEISLSDIRSQLETRLPIWPYKYPDESERSKVWENQMKDKVLFLQKLIQALLREKLESKVFFLSSGTLLRSIYLMHGAIMNDPRQTDSDIDVYLVLKDSSLEHSHLSSNSSAGPKEENRHYIIQYEGKMFRFDIEIIGDKRLSNPANNEDEFASAELTRAIALFGEDIFKGLNIDRQHSMVYVDILLGKFIQLLSQHNRDKYAIMRAILRLDKAIAEINRFNHEFALELRTKLYPFLRMEPYEVEGKKNIAISAFSDIYNRLQVVSSAGGDVGEGDALAELKGAGEVSPSTALRVNSANGVLSGTISRADARGEFEKQLVQWQEMSEAERAAFEKEVTGAGYIIEKDELSEEEYRVLRLDKIGRTSLQGLERFLAKEQNQPFRDYEVVRLHKLVYEGLKDKLEWFIEKALVFKNNTADERIKEDVINYYEFELDDLLAQIHKKAKVEFGEDVSDFKLYALGAEVRHVLVFPTLRLLVEDFAEFVEEWGEQGCFDRIERIVDGLHGGIEWLKRMAEGRRTEVGTSLRIAHKVVPQIREQHLAALVVDADPAERIAWQDRLYSWGIEIVLTAASKEEADKKIKFARDNSFRLAFVINNIDNEQIVKEPVNLTFPPIQKSIPSTIPDQDLAELLMSI